ncbi:MAG: threonylcarbamoyl-AMP synthase [Magnetococcales bacterium]|nr:threonylcarbamoyl-AMP synthase [Magnetococcales bacterium]
MQAAITALRQGQVIGLPTETLFGLAADPFQPEAVARLIRMKERPPEKGFILLIPDARSLTGLIEPPGSLALRLMERFWPGPLTLVLPACSDLPPVLTGGTGFLAVRHSPSPVVERLLALWRGPLISTSANRAGEPPPPTTEAVRHIWRHEALMVIDGLIRPDAEPSTLLRVAGEQATLLRPGAIPLAALQPLISHHSGRQI